LRDPLFWYANAAFLLLAIGSIVWAKSPEGRALSRIVTYLKMVCLTYVIVHLVRTPQHLRALNVRGIRRRACHWWSSA
jgi:hypothetical protein